MKAKKPLLFLMVGLLAMSFALPAMAQTSRPAYMIDPADVPGWYLYDEAGIAEEWNWSGGIAGFLSFDAWYQIWINNQSSTPTPWLNATAAMALLTIDMSIDLGTNFIIFNLWDLVVQTLLGLPLGFEEKTVPGLEGCVTYNNSGFWAALGFKGEVLIVALGWGSETPPGNPFGGGVLAGTMTPTDSTVSESDILNLMSKQGLEFQKCSVDRR